MKEYLTSFFFSWFFLSLCVDLARASRRPFHSHGLISAGH
jgi:hypothetical protein